MSKRVLMVALVVSGVIALLMVGPAMSGKPVKVDVCHYPPDDPDNFHIISVSENAVAAHENHGDHVVGDEVCDDGVDNDCNGETDEGCDVGCSGGFSGSYQMDFVLLPGGGLFPHVLNVTSGPDGDGDFEGDGNSISNPAVTWDADGSIDDSADPDGFVMTFVYNNVNSGYTVNMTGTFSDDCGTITGGATSNANQTFTFVMYPTN